MSFWSFTRPWVIAQVECYDPKLNLVYFQSTSFANDDDIGTMSIAFINLSEKTAIPLLAVSPSQFGYMGFQYVLVA